MKSDPIREKVKAYYESQSMPQQNLERMKAALFAAGHRQEAGPGRRWGRKILEAITHPLRYGSIPATATAMALLLVVNLAVWYQWQRSAQMGITTDIAREIAMNHQKNLESEFHATSIDALRSAMPALDFKPFAPDLISRLGLIMQGARYCSIQGHLAVQIKLKNSKGQNFTIYQAPCLPPLEQLQRTKMNLDNLQITMWNEDGLFIGLASPDV